MTRAALLLLAAAWTVTRCFADAPAFEHLFPAGLSPNSTNTVTLGGKFEPWPPRFWTSCPGVTFATDTNKNRVQIQVAPDAPPGPHLLRAYNDDGPSAARIFVISNARQALEKEPNDHFASPQPVSALPLTINGHLNKSGDVDSFAVKLKTGQWLDAHLDAYVLAGKVDALLRLVTPEGVQLAWNHDFGTLDPRLIWQAPTAGIYVLQVMGFRYPADAQVQLTGGDGCVYRLHLDASGARPGLFNCGLTEQEPNNAATNATLVSLPARVHGAIDTAGDEDWFGVSLNKDEALELTVAAGSLGSPLDVVAKLVDRQGKDLARTDDPGRFGDPRLEWKASTNTTVYAVIRNLLHSGGSDYAYRLDLRTLAPGYRANAAADSITAAAGTTNDVKLTMTRFRGFDHKLLASIAGLPEGVSAEAVALSDKGGEAVLKLVVSSDAKPAQGPVRLLIKDEATSEVRVAPFRLTSATEDNGVPGGYTRLLVEMTDELWLTVKPKPAAK